MSWDWTFSPTKLNHFYAGGNNWVRTINRRRNTSATGRASSAWATYRTAMRTLSTSSATPYSTWGGQADNGSENTVYAYNDDFTWIHGKHTFKFGGMYQLNHYNGFGRQCEAGCVGFSYQETGVPAGPPIPTSAATRSRRSCWVTPTAARSTRSASSANSSRTFGGYFQDDWRITSKLVLNLGVRWDGNCLRPASPTAGLTSDLPPRTPRPATFPAPSSSPVAARAVSEPVPWRTPTSTPSGRASGLHSLNDKTVIRGGVGISYAAITTVTGSTHTMGFTLTQGFSNTSNGIQPTFLLKNGLPAWTAPPFINPSVTNDGSPSWWQGNEATRPPQEYAFNLSIQHQLSPSTVLEVSYNGAMGAHLQTGLLKYNQIPIGMIDKYGSSVLTSNINSAAGIASGVTAPFSNFSTLWGSRGTVGQALKPFPQYVDIDTTAGGGDHSGHSTYHAGIIRVEKRYSRGLTFSASYVLSKLLTDSDRRPCQAPPGWTVF